MLNQEPDDYGHKLLWAACCLGFFCFTSLGRVYNQVWRDVRPYLAHKHIRVNITHIQVNSGSADYI